LDTNNTGLPKFAISSLSPNVGPIFGDTILTLQGLGIDRILSRFNYIDSSQFGGLATGKISSFSCVMEFCPGQFSSSGCQNLSATPLVWNTTAAVEYIAQTDGELTLRVGDQVTVYGCNPCASTDSSGKYNPGRLVARVNGKIGFAPGDLQMYSGELRDRVYCSSAPSGSTGYAQLFLVGQSSPTGAYPFLTGDYIMMNTETMFMFQYYSYEQLVRIAPDYAPLRFQGGTRGPSDIDQPVTITVTGIYFVMSSYFTCMFYDVANLDDQCRSPASRVDDGTLTCVMPQMKLEQSLSCGCLQTANNFPQVTSSSGCIKL